MALVFSLFGRHITLFILLLVPLLRTSPATAAQTYTNITLGSTFTTDGPNASWPSPSGDFAFGFRPLNNSSSLFLLAIWFAKTLDRNVVWSANGVKPVPSGSKLSLTANGQLSLRDPYGQEVWNTSTKGASHAAILDTGNLILAGADFNVEWQSFGSPTDTILPTQVLGLGTQLLSRLTDADYSDGRFQLDLQTDGNLVFYRVALPSGISSIPYWTSNTVGSGTQLVFSASGDIYLAGTNGARVNLTSAAKTSIDGFYRRATLDPDGVLRPYLYPKNGTAIGSWGEGWTAVASFPSSCFTVDLGSGPCGINSYCVVDGNQQPDCRCPPHYSFIDPSRRYIGCAPDFALPSCTADGTSNFSLSEITDTAVSMWSSDYEYRNFNEEQCRNGCLNDCLCAAVVYISGGCWKKKMPLSNGVARGGDSRKTLVKVSIINSTTTSGPQPCTNEGEGVKISDRRSTTLILVESILLGSSAFLNLLFIAVIFMLLTLVCYNKRNRKLEPADPSIPWLNLRSFTYKELEAATNGFSDELGSGAFGTVYKGLLPSSEPRLHIAVKRLDKLLAKETEKEFMNEVRAIGQTHHKNLVKLYGFCSEGESRLLVYEYMSNGALNGCLFGGGEKPGWNHRIGVAKGIARGLLYLHEECSTQIIHCDIKPQNILLDKGGTARISDFGLAKLLKTEQTRTNTGIRGTKGYVAPEWFKNMAVTAKVDVYSFGVMLLEIVCCRRSLEPDAAEEEVVLTDWAYDCYRDGRVNLLVEGDEEAAADGRMVERLVKVAIWCIQEEPSMRPSMLKVTQMLEGSVMVGVPPDPWSYILFRDTHPNMEISEEE